MTNEIFKKCTSRPRKLKPTCPNKLKLCTRERYQGVTTEKCRCDMKIKYPKCKLPPLDKTLKHRMKVVDTIRRKQVQALDYETAVQLKEELFPEEKVEVKSWWQKIKNWLVL